MEQMVGRWSAAPDEEMERKRLSMGEDGGSKEKALGRQHTVPMLG